MRLRTGKLVRAKESSSDLVQSVCREILADLSRFEYRDEVTFRQWLYESALRKIVDRQRYWNAAKRDAAREVALQSPSAGLEESQLLQSYASVATPSQQAEAREQIERLERAFDKLPDHFRQAITLAKLVGLSHAQIAEQMGRTEASVRNLVPRALARLSMLLTNPR